MVLPYCSVVPLPHGNNPTHQSGHHATFFYFWCSSLLFRTFPFSFSLRPSPSLPRRNLDAGSPSRLFSPLSTTARAFISIARRLPLALSFLVDSHRIAMPYNENIAKEEQRSGDCGLSSCPVLQFFFSQNKKLAPIVAAVLFAEPSYAVRGGLGGRGGGGCESKH